MVVELRNCNSIDFGKININENLLNIYYAINGTGKSTIAKAISARNDSNAMGKLRPFKHINSADDVYKPDVSGLDGTANVVIFNEDFVSQFVFKHDELIQNSFEIFIRTPDYERQLQIIDGLIKETKDAFSKNPELDELINVFTVFIDGFGKAQGGYSAAGAIGKGFGKGNKIHNIPEGLTPYKSFIENNVDGSNVKWLKWHLAGNGFIDVANQCPYCAKEANDETKSTILKISEEFDPKSVEHLNKMLEVFERLKVYFSDMTKQKIDEISKNVSGLSSEQKAYLIEIKDQVSTLKEKLWKIKTMSFVSLKDVDRIVNEISSYKIDLSYLPHLNSDHSQKKVEIINTTLDTILSKATELQAAVGRQNSTIKKIISENSKEINSFLKYAGYEYSVLLEDDGKGSYKLNLKHKDIANTVSEVTSHLSFGERNAFALVLFMYHTLNLNPDLIVLDDPISSFDGNKKYAILYKLFKEKRSFKDKTVILLTHEFGTVIDTIYNMPKTINARARHLENRNGQLIEKEISKDKIKAFPMIAKENVQSANQKICKLIYLRRLLEVENRKSDAWQLLSNIFKDGREKPLVALPDGIYREMKPEEITSASNSIREYIADFEYDRDYEQIQNKTAMASLYVSSTSNYEKLQLYRIINSNNNSNNVIKKFVNETFHIENDYLFQLNPLEYEMIPWYVVNACDNDIRQIFPDLFIVRDSVIDDAGTIQRVLNTKRRRIPLFAMPASAGIGHWIDDTDHTDILVDNIECDFATYISGDSMEPTIQDKSIVLVKLEPNIDIGSIGIFNLNGNIYCNQLGREALISLNRAYNPIEINEYDELRTQGKVIRVILPTSIDNEVEFL